MCIRDRPHTVPSVPNPVPSQATPRAVSYTHLKQEIPLDLASDIASTNDDGFMTVRGTTLPGAVVKVLSPTRTWTSPTRP